MKYKLFLDDERFPSQCFDYMKRRAGDKLDVYKQDKWVIARNYDEFISVIKQNGVPELISFDHDLAEEHYVYFSPTSIKDKQYADIYKHLKEKTGYDCALWLINYCTRNKIQIPAYLVHSKNQLGKNQIEETLKHYVNYQKERNDFVRVHTSQNIKSVFLFLFSKEMLDMFVTAN